MVTDKLAKTFKSYYHRDLQKLFNFITGDSKSVLNISNDQMAQNIDTISKRNQVYDYIVLSNALGCLNDIQSTLKQVKKLCHANSRIIINFHNFVWQPLIDLAQTMGLKTKQPRINWLNRDDIENLLTLENFEIIKSGQRMLIPLPVVGVSDFVNKYLIHVPILNKLCLVNFAVARQTNFQSKKLYSVSIVVPARNEEGNIENIVKGFSKLNLKYELIFIEGHSKDYTWRRILEMQKKYPTTNIVAKKQTGVGKADAVRKGFNLAKNDILMIWDADLTVNPKEFYKFYDAITSGKGEFVFGSRLVYPLEKEAMRTLNILGNKIFSWLFSWLLGQPIKDTLCGTKVISRLNYIKLAKNRKYFGDFDPFGDFDLIFGAAKLNLKFVEIPIRYQSRTYGQTNISRFSHGWLLFKMVIFALNKLKFV